MLRLTDVMWLSVPVNQSTRVTVARTAMIDQFDFTLSLLLPKQHVHSVYAPSLHRIDVLKLER